MVLILFIRIKSPSSIMKEWYRSLFRALRYASDTNLQLDVVNVSAEAAEQKIIVGNPRWSQKLNVHVQHAGRPLHDERPGLPTYLASFILSPGGLFTCTVLVFQIWGDSDSHRSRDGSRTERYNKLRTRFNSWNGCLPFAGPVWRWQPAVWNGHVLTVQAQSRNSWRVLNCGRHMVELYKLSSQHAARESCIQITCSTSSLYCYNNECSVQQYM